MITHGTFFFALLSGRFVTPTFFRCPPTRFLGYMDSDAWPGAAWIVNRRISRDPPNHPRARNRRKGVRRSCTRCGMAGPRLKTRPWAMKKQKLHIARSRLICFGWGFRRQSTPAFSLPKEDDIYDLDIFGRPPSLKPISRYWQNLNKIRKKCQKTGGPNRIRGEINLPAMKHESNDTREL